MGLQISCGIHTKVSTENTIQSVKKRYTADNKRFVQVERRRDNRRKHDARSCASVIKYTAENEYIELHGIPEGEERNDDIRATCKPKIQVRKQKFLGNRILCKYSRNQYCNDTKIYPRTGKAGSDRGFALQKRICRPFQG